ncbi:TolC family protein [Paucibacter sp. AS339]|uniref:TolC family protein n=1 Tax=Paucibacter hankyongi TaxID=3133434 RepID=UPI0030A46EEC
MATVFAAVHRCWRQCAPVAAAFLLLSSADMALAQSQGQVRKPGKAAAANAPAPASKEQTASPSMCGEEDALPSSRGRDASTFEPSAVDPRSQLIDLVNLAIQRSQAQGASNLLAQAARDEWEEARAARMPQVSLGASLLSVGNKPSNQELVKGTQGHASLQVTAPLYSSGRIEQLANWRGQLAESARYGMLNSEQQIALQTVALALDRSRYNLQIQVYGQYVRRMSCLIESLETIVKSDKGRSSELVQAQKTRQQIELTVDQVRSTLRQIETRLRRFVGDVLPPSASYSSLLMSVPAVDEMQNDASEAAEVQQLAAQARAQSSYAESVQAANRPQVSLAVNLDSNTGLSKSNAWGAGLSVTIPIFTPGSDYGLSAARKRAEAARLQKEDSIESRRYRVLDVHESATSSFARARSVVEILRNSDRLRTATLQQWQLLGRRSLFDVIGAESDYYGLRILHLNALSDGQQAVAILWSMGRGVMTPIK